MLSRKIPIIITLVGLSLVASIWTLSLMEVGDFGGEGANIGAGFLLLIGYILTLGGLVALVSIWISERSERKK
jgi:hypothetical protein